MWDLDYVILDYVILDYVILDYVIFTMTAMNINPYKRVGAAVSCRKNHESRKCNRITLERNLQSVGRFREFARLVCYVAEISEFPTAA